MLTYDAHVLLDMLIVCALLNMLIVCVLLDMLIIGVLFEMLIASMLLPLYGCVCVCVPATEFWAQ